MPKGRPWGVEEEVRLRELVGSGLGLEVVAARLGKSRNAVYLKCRRLGLSVREEGVGCSGTSSSVELPGELPSVEEALRILAGALVAAGRGGLGKVEVRRLQVVATLARTYEQLLARYIDYRGIEARLVELEAKYAKLAEKAEGEEA